QGLQCVRNVGYAIRAYPYPVVPVRHHLTYLTIVGTHNGKHGKHRLAQYPGLPFVVRREQEYVCKMVESSQPIVSYEPEEEDAVGNTELDGKPLQLGAERTVPGDHVVEVRNLRSRPRESPQHSGNVLRGSQPRDGKENHTVGRDLAKADLRRHLQQLFTRRRCLKLLEIFF